MTILHLHNECGDVRLVSGHAYNVLRNEVLGGRNHQLKLIKNAGFTHFLGQEGERKTLDFLPEEFAAGMAPRILEATYIRLAVRRFYDWLCVHARIRGTSKPGLLAPLKRERRHWSVHWEEGPHDWVQISMGLTFAGRERGPFPHGLHGPGWYAEPQNHWMMNFHKR